MGRITSDPHKILRLEQTTQDALQRQLNIDYHSGKRKNY
jgi:hypothetical protein